MFPAQRRRWASCEAGPTVLPRGAGLPAAGTTRGQGLRGNPHGPVPSVQGLGVTSALHLQAGMAAGPQVAAPRAGAERQPPRACP